MRATSSVVAIWVGVFALADKGSQSGVEVEAVERGAEPGVDGGSVPTQTICSPSSS